ncbi:MAG: hypothetical protein Ct9H90mP4_08080 [Gammaproteobacteria bacterium]|nr:MAG: hypothetical protein Ct9H90mP4_08080 [Gammaproteobacteria bacterium]
MEKNMKKVTLLFISLIFLWSCSVENEKDEDSLGHCLK